MNNIFYEPIMRSRAETCKKYSAIVLIKIDFALFLPPSIFKVLMSCFFMARFLIQESVKIRKGHGKKKFFYKTQKGRSVQSKVSKMFLNYTYLVSDLVPYCYQVCIEGKNYSFSIC